MDRVLEKEKEVFVGFVGKRRRKSSRWKVLSIEFWKDTGGIQITQVQGKRRGKMHLPRVPLSRLKAP